MSPLAWELVAQKGAQGDTGGGSGGGGLVESAKLGTTFSTTSTTDTPVLGLILYFEVLATDGPFKASFNSMVGNTSAGQGAGVSIYLDGVQIDQALPVPVATSIGVRVHMVDELDQITPGWHTVEVRFRAFASGTAFLSAASNATPLLMVEKM